MVGDLNLFAKNNTGLSLLKKFWPTEFIFPYDEIKNCILEQSIPGDVIYIQYCHLTPLLLHGEIANRSVTYFESRKHIYKILKVIFNSDEKSNTEVDKFWREFQPVLRQKELEGAFLPNACKRDINYILNRPETLQVLNNGKKEEFQPADTHFNIDEKIRDTVYSILSFAKTMHCNERDSFVTVAENMFRYYKEVRDGMAGYSKELITNEDVQSKKRRKANFILLLPFLQEDLQKFGPRIKFQDTLGRIFNLYSAYLTRSGKLALIMPNKKYYPELIYQEAEKEGWFLNKFSETNNLSGSYLYYTFVRQNHNPISGSLKRLQKVNLFDFEKEIIKEIEVFLEKKKVASLHEVRNHLMFNCQSGYPQQPLAEILNEYFPNYKGLYFYGSIPPGRKKAWRKSKDAVGELCCRYLLLHKKFVCYDTLFDFISNVKFGSLFSLPYYYAIKKECHQRGFKTPGDLFASTVKNSSVLRRLLLKMDEFFEPLPNMLIGLLLLDSETNINNFLDLLRDYSPGNCPGTLKAIKNQLDIFLNKVAIDPREKEMLLADTALQGNFKISNQQ